MNALIYDLEIIKAIAGKEPPLPDTAYCEGWHDHVGMGISVLCAYDYQEDRYRVFMEDNLGEFFVLCSERGPLIGFNNIAFDNAVLAANNLILPDDRCYDLLRELWITAGLGPKFVYPSHAGYGLDAVCQSNNLGRKTGDGALAPILWQRGQRGKVVDYCLNDIFLTKQLFDVVAAGDYVTSPKDGAQLELRNPVVAPI